MRSNFIIFFILTLITASLSLEASELCKDTFKTYLDVIKCAEEKSGEIQAISIEIERAKAEVQIAGQWKNPELSAESFLNKSGGKSGSETEISIGVPLEIGGKISARKAMSEGNVAQVEAKYLLARAKVRSELLLKLHRLRQLLHEEEVINETIAAFTKIVNQYSGRLKLSPEQQISMSVFKMSKSEYEIKKIEIHDEMATLDSFFKVAVSNNIQQLKSIVPPSIKTWPQIKNTYQTGNSPNDKILQAQLKTSLASLSLAQKETIPTFTVGPSFKIQKQDGNNEQSYGINISFPFPLFNTNNGERHAAAKDVTLSETRLHFARLEEGQYREQLVQVYLESIRVLLSTISHNEIENRHVEVENLFFKGLVPSSLMIEAHRTYIELEATRNQREIKALETLLAIYTIDGQTTEINL